jgi:hypothetical protein
MSASCLSAENDCFLHPDICGQGETCVVRLTTGNGGCDLGLSVDDVGMCIAM